jgi:surface protein
MALMFSLTLSLLSSPIVAYATETEDVSEIMLDASDSDDSQEDTDPSDASEFFDDIESDVIESDEADIEDEEFAVDSEEVISESDEEYLVFGAEDDIASGSYGQTQWRVTSAGELIVTGTGDAYEETEEEWSDYGTSHTSPWTRDDECREQIKKATISLKQCANFQGFFADCESLEYVDLSGTSGDGTREVLMDHMFYDCSSLKSIKFGDFSTANVVDMNNMFTYCNAIEEMDLSGINTSKVTNMSGLFFSFGMDLESLNLNGFDTSSVVDMSEMFAGCGVEELDLSGFDTSSVVDMSEMFDGCDVEELDLSGFDTSKVTNMRNMFASCWASLINLSGFDTSNVTDMSGMFAGCYAEELDLSGFNTSNVTNMSGMFRNANDLTSISLGSGFVTSKVTNMYRMFEKCVRLVTVDTSNWDTSKVTNMSSMFDNCHCLKTVDTSNWNTSGVTDMSYMFRQCIMINDLDVSGWITSNVKDMKYLFAWCRSVEELDVSNWDTSNVTLMTEMFQDCVKLTELDVSGFDTSKVTDMAGMFNGSSHIKRLDLSKWDTSSTKSMPWLFSNCSGLESVDLSGFDTSKVYFMWYMFYGCSSLKSLDVSMFDTSSLTEANDMFGKCSSLETLDLSSFSLEKITEVSGMLSGCTNLKTIRTPKKSALPIALPSNKWKNYDTMEDVTEIPANCENSLYLFKNEVSLSFDKDSFELNKNETATITVHASPIGVDLTQVAWSSTDEAVVTVEGTATGAVITAGDSEGTATITATLEDATATANVKVMVPLRLDKKEITFTENSDVIESINASVIDSYKDYVLYKVVDELDNVVDDLITVTKVGSTFEYRIALKKDLALEDSRTVFFKVYANRDGKEVSDVCKVTVNPQPSVSAPVASIGKNGETTSVTAGIYVSLRSETLGSTIFYTIDGVTIPTCDDNGEPLEGVLKYTDRIKIGKATTIMARSYKKGYRQSAVAMFTYTIDEAAWGDLEGNTAVQALFDNKSSNVPEDIWYLVGDNKYETSGDTAYTEVYTGNKITFNDKISVYCGTSKLIENRDYAISYSNNLNAAGVNAENPKTHKRIAPTVVIKGKGNYSKSSNLYFGIVPDSIDNALITSERVVSVIAGAKAKLANNMPVVTYNGKKLSLDKDYVLKYYNGESIDDADLIQDPSAVTLDTPGKTYTIRIIGKEGSNHTGEKVEVVLVKTIDSTDKNIVQTSKLKFGDAANKAIKVPYDKDKVYTAESLFNNAGEGEPFAYVFIKGATKDALTYGTDYEVQLLDEDNNSAGVHGFVILGKGNYVGTKTGSYEITGTAMKSVKIAGLSTSVEYTGKAITLADLFKADKVTADPNGDKNPSDAWTEVTLYTVDTKTKVKKVLRRYDADAATETESVTPDITNADYVIKMANTGVTGKFVLSFIGLNGFTGTITKNITVKAYNVKNDTRGSIYVDDIEAVGYCKTGAKPSVVVRYVYEWNTDIEGNRTTPKYYSVLREGIDYTLSYKNNLKPSEGATKNLPTVMIKCKGNYTGTNATKTFVIKKAKVEDNVIPTVGDVVYKSNGKKGYFQVIPKLMDDGKAVAAGKNKEIEAIAKTDYEYYYAENTVLEDAAKTPKTAGMVVDPEDKVAPGTMIRVVVPVAVKSASSPYILTERTELSAIYRVIDEGKDISKFTAKVNDPSKLTFHNGDDIIPIKKSDITISYKEKGSKQTKVLNESDYEIISVKNNRFLGTATVTVHGLGEYGGVKTFTFKIGARIFS